MKSRDAYTLKHLIESLVRELSSLEEDGVSTTTHSVRTRTKVQEGLAILRDEIKFSTDIEKNLGDVK